MSWVVEEWKDGLPGKALQKIREIEGQLDQLKKERQQKLFQVDSLEAALQKQKQKVDSEKSDAAVLKRENQSLVESCENLEKTRQKVTHDLQVKEQQVNYLEGQLNSSKRQIERLEQELKKNKNELDRSQTSHTTDLQPYSTPQKTFAAPATPTYRQNESKFEELQGKYNQEVEERKRLEAEIKVVKLLNQSTMSHKDIARQQTGSSIFPWQQEQTHSRQSQSVLETPSKRRNGASSFSWNSEETPVRQSQHNTSVSQSDPRSSQQMEQLRTLNQDLKIKVSELEVCLQAQEKDMKNQINKFQETQSQLDKARKDLAEKDKSLIKSRDELTKISGQHEQVVTKCSSVEQKLKQVTEEMSCQRHNAEITRRGLEQKIKDLERDSQKELAQLQKSHQALDQQFNQTKTKMNQEVQQAKKDSNVLQSEIEKVTSLKNRLEKELEEQKQKIFRSEQGLQASQAKETELKKKFDEMQREKNSLSCQLEQGTRKLTQLEEEKKTAEQNLKKTHTMVEDLKAKTQTQSEELNGLRTKLESQSKSSAQDLENLKKSLSELEERNAKSQNEVQKQKHDMERMTNKTIALEKENQDLQITANSRLNEVIEMKKEYESLLEWKNEKEQMIKDTESQREGMLSKIGELEKSAETLTDAHRGLEDKLQNLKNEKQCLSGQIDSLKGELLNKCVELEEKGRLYEELQKQHHEADQKYCKDSENSVAQITLLQGQVRKLEIRIQQETSKVERMEQSHSELLVLYESACDLAKSKDSIIELNQNETAHLQECVSQAVALQEQQLDQFTQEKCSLMKECEEGLSQKADEAEQAKLDLVKCQQDMLLLQEQIPSLESTLKFQKCLSVELQIKYDDLSKVKADLLEKITEAERKEEGFLNEINVLSEQAKSVCSLQEQCNSFAATAEENKIALESMQEIQNQTANDLQSQKTRTETLEMQMNEADAKASNLEKENGHLEDKLQTLEKEAEDLSAKYQSLQEVHNGICGEKDDLLKQISTLSEVLAEKEVAADMSATLTIELESSKQLCAELKSSLEGVQKMQASVMELKSNLENSLKDKSEKIVSQAKDIKELSEKSNKESEGYVLEMEIHLQKQKSLKEQIDVIKAQLENKCHEATATKEKLDNISIEMSELKQDLAASTDKLREVNDSYQVVCQEIESWKQTASSHEQELTALKSSEEEKGCEIQTLKQRLHDAEFEQTKASDTLKEKAINMNKIKVQLEMLQMDLEDNEASMTSFDSQMEELQGTISTLENKLDKSEVQRSTLQVELASVQEQLLEKDCEVSQYITCLEDAHKQQHSISTEQGQLLAELESSKETLRKQEEELESLQAANEKLNVTLEEELCKHTNIEKMCNNLTEQKLKLDSQFEELQRDYQIAQEGMDELKQENDRLQNATQNLMDQSETLSSALEQATQRNDEASLKNKEFEEEQMELHQQLSFLQNEHALLKDQYSGLLSQVTEQQSHIEQLQQKDLELNPATEEVSRSSSFVNISLHAEEDHEELKHTCENISDVLHSSAIIEMQATDSCVLPCEDEAIPLIISSATEQSGSQTEVKAAETPLQSDEDDIDLPIEEQLQLKSRELEELSHAFEEAVRTLEGQMEAQLEQLKLQHAKELQNFQQKMVNLKHDLEAKLVDKRQQTEILSSQLEVTRLQMQELELASRSLLSADIENHLQEIEDDATLPNKSEKELECELLTASDAQCELIGGPAEATANDAIHITQLSDGVDILTLMSSQLDECITHECKKQAVSTSNTYPGQGLLLAELETSKETLRKQEEEIQHLHSQFEVLTSEMTIRKELCMELERKVHETEMVKSDSIGKLNSVIQEKQKLNQLIEQLTEEVNALKLQLQTSKCQLSDVMEMLEGLEMAKGGWDEKFFQIESDLKKARSEKANLEKHILSMEADIEEIEEQKHKLGTELESSKKANVNLEQQLNVTKVEGGQLKQELFMCTEERENDHQSLLKWKEKAAILDKNQADTRELIKILEEDIRIGKRQIEVGSSQIDGLLKEKEQLLQQFQTLQKTMAILSGDNEDLLRELNRFKNDINAASRESETMVSKLEALEDENSRLSQSLESSLLEKGEIASRLISTQEEVAQMRAGIEKLKVRIESDERKKSHVSQLLKDAQRKADSLQDNIEKLEQEKEMSDQSLEDAVLQAEMAKAELEELDTEKEVLAKTIEGMTVELNDLRDEKDRLEKELIKKNELIEQLQKSKQVVSEKLESVEKSMKEAEISQKNVVEELQSKVGAVEVDLQLCRNELESTQLKEQEFMCQLLSCQTENEQFVQKLQETEKLQSVLQSTNQSLQKDFAAKQQELSESREENDELQLQVAELQVLPSLMEERDELEKEKVRLQSAAIQWEEKTQLLSAKSEVMQITIASLETNVKRLENHLDASKLINAELTPKVNTLHESNLKLQSQLNELSGAKEMQEALEQNRNSLTTQLQESQQQAESYKLSSEMLASEKEDLRRNLAGMQESLAHELKERETRHEEAVKQIQQQHEVELQTVKDDIATVEGKAIEYLSEISCLKSSKEEVNSALMELQSKLEQCEKNQVELNTKVARLSKEKDRALSKMNLWMKTCKQLESEKQALQEEIQQQGEQITTLKASQKPGDGGCSAEDVQADVEELKKALEEKTREADESVDRYCSLMVKVHKLEETNETLKNKVKQLTSQSTAIKSRRSAANVSRKPEESGLENSKPVEEAAECQLSGKRQRVADSTPSKAHEALHNIAKRIRAGSTPKANQSLTNQDDDDFRPEGLPELVKKGFADIPMGEMSPFIMRRTTVQRCSPRLAARRSPAALLSFSEDTSVQSPHPPAEGSILQIVQQPKALQSSSSVLMPVANSPRGKGFESPVANSPRGKGFESPVANSRRGKGFESPVAGLEDRKTRRSLSTKKTPEQQEKRRQVLADAEQEETCHVQ